MGSIIQVHYADNSTALAYPDGRGRYLPGSTGAVNPPPVDPPPVDPPQAGQWIHPLPGSVMTSPFGPRGWDGVGNYHYGTDFSTTTALVGGDIVAPADLVVTIARRRWGNGGSAGNCVKAHTTDRKYTLCFYHMAEGSIGVTEGSTIPRGTRIGSEGQTGNVTGTHLHFEVYEGVWNDPWPPPYNYGANVVDPAPVLRANGVNF